MSQVTIQCRLIASQPTRQQLWKLMGELNTPLINELLRQMPQHPEFETWRQQGKLPADIVTKLCEPLKSDPRYIGQPGRFYTSAIALVKYIYKSWFKLQQRLERRLKGQRRWLEMLKSDAELVEQSSCSKEQIRTQAIAILASHKPENQSPQPAKQRKKRQKSKTNKSLSQTLFDTYDKTQDLLTRSVICYLLKNGCKIPTKPEEAEKIPKSRRKAEIKIARILDQLNSRTPKGRDLTGEKWLETLLTATTTAPASEAEARSWQNILLTKPKSIPFPVAYETNEDLTWSRNSKGRLCVHFNGFKEYTFEIYCDQRQLKYFERFYQDQELKGASENKYSAALFTLRSGRILWIQGTGKGEPWNINYLNLHCTIETRLWTAEGTKQVSQEKAVEIAQSLARSKEKGNLTKNQQASVKRRESTLALLPNPFPRPSQPLYQGQSDIIVGVALGLEKPATVAVVDASTGKAITYRSIKQLLGKKNPLLNRQRTQKRVLSHQRHEAQKNAAFNEFGESELGQHVDRLIAKAIISLAKTHKAASIVLPKLDNMRELVQSEIQARAELKIPGCTEAQQKYAKQYRIQVHQWGYGRLINNIKAQAAKLGIVIEEEQQPIRDSPPEKALAMAISAFNSRYNS